MILSRLYRLCRQAAFVLISLPLPVLAAANPIVIGQAIDLSGLNGSIGRDYVAGIKTYFDALNAAGGIGGRRIRYIARDDRGMPATTAKMTAELIERDQAEYLLGGIGDAAVQAVLADPVFQRSGLTLFAPLASAGGRLATSQVMFWRPGYQQEIRHIFSHFAKLGMKRIGVAYQPSPSNLDAYRGLSEEIRAHHMPLTATMHLDTAPDGFRADASRMAASHPDFVLVIADTIGTGLFLKEFRRHSAQTFVAGTSLINLAMLRELAGAQAVEWTVFSQVVPNPNASASPLQAEHISTMKKYRDESVSSLTLEGFAAAKSLAKMIELARPSSRTALQEGRAQKRMVDLGGLSIMAADGAPLSSYLDIALFRKGGGLVF
jgi:ABC-type branched-subunit amino acid transport system substrate-binding protein